ncbi:MAG TPA: xanthine dehydrogenase accessory protein XdhC, partial [Burkholderiaceae bacterium]|nr:xanthine dehydrogenase accessory protein XdhC [Burkholderiaceae bacterium]
MQHWLSALTQAETEAVVLVTVAAVRGSSPREPGAKMVVTARQQFDTIGGGHLELRAVEIAREMLDPSMPAAAACRLERFPLAASLGQCCGGVVHLAFERLDASAGSYVRELQRRWQARIDTWRLSALDLPLAPLLCERDGTRPLPQPGSALASTALPELSSFDPQAPCQILQAANGSRWLLDPCLAWRAHLYLFGAGHVGRAIVRALADLPCHVTWIDQRDDMFPADVPANVRIEVTDTPQALIDDAAPGSHFLIMTHSHPLDQELVEAILRRDDAGWLGLIGSHSSGASGRSRALRRQVSARACQRRCNS